MAETWTLDGVAINDNTSFRIAGEVDMTPPRQRQEWIGGADSEWQALARDPLHENREIVIPLEVVPTATKDQAHDKVGQIVDKLRLASRTPSGIALTWAPHNSSRTVTFDVLAGEITGLPLDFMFVNANMPRPTLRLVCKPEWRGSETTTSTASSSTPFVTLEVANVPGDRPALGRLIVTDTATQSRRHVEWGLEGQYYNASTSLLVASDDMVTSGFGGSQTTTSGAYDPNASGNNSITCALTTSATAVAGTGNLSHVGTFRVKARVQATTTSVQVRLVWQSADGPWNENDWTTLRVGGSNWEELDLGAITVPPVTVGTQRWTGRIDARTTTGTDTIKLNYLEMVPTLDGYGKARATVNTGVAGVVMASDEYTSTTAGGALNARVAPTGGTWATSGDATDFVFADNFTGLSGEQLIRTAASGTNGRYAVLGATNYTDMQVRTQLVAVSTAMDVGATKIQGALARWVDSSNHLRGLLTMTRPSGSAIAKLQLVTLVTGTPTTIAESAGLTITTGEYVLRLTTYATGTAILEILDGTGTAVLGAITGASSALATGGALDDGKPGQYHLYTGASTITAGFDDFSMSIPPAEPIALYSGRNMQFRHDDTIRQDSTGTYTGSPPSYRGSRFLVPTGTSRVMVKARRNDVEVAADANVTDSLQIQVAYTPRGIAVPR